jgi:type 1 glutamine amidotransferase
MVQFDHHATLGAFFLNHPPVQQFTVDVTDADHPITAGLDSTFDTSDELYLIEALDPECQVLFTTDLPVDPSPPGFGFEYADDTSLLADGHTRILGYSRREGDGEVVYVALGHTHSPETNSQPFVDVSVAADTVTPPTFRGSWDTEAFTRVLRNAVAWGLGREPVTSA